VPVRILGVIARRWFWQVRLWPSRLLHR
jgi:hypothetical protein